MIDENMTIIKLAVIILINSWYLRVPSINLGILDNGTNNNWSRMNPINSAKINAIKWLVILIIAS